MTSADSLVVRARRDSDLPALLEILRRTHELEGYPVRASAVRTGWLAEPHELAGVVAEHDSRVVGQIALHPTAAPGHDAGEDAAVEQWQQAVGRPAEQLAVVSRFVTDRSVPGAGTALLDHAVTVADGLGRAPVLLVDPTSAAVGFYLRRGWQHIGTARQQWGHRSVDAVLMVLPGAGY